MRFAALVGWRHGFVLRQPGVDVAVEREEAVARLWPWHASSAESLVGHGVALCLAEQVHGIGVAVVDAQSAGMTAGVDGLISRDAGVALGIYVADCCAVFLADERTGAVGLVHSGKKGSEGGITGVALARMSEAFGTRAADVTVVLSPCIRPPAYEVDFAAQIRAQAMALGVKQVSDDGLCTSADLERFYSYRVEKGKTGRMLAVLRARAAV
jgi:polyphenol oxidase